MTGATPGQALSPDPAVFAYHARSTAFNVLTGKMSGGGWCVPRNERDAIACAVVEAVEPLIRADERALAAQQPHAADGGRSFEDMLADPREQFDLRSELLASISEYAAAPPASAGIKPWHPRGVPQPAPGIPLRSDAETCDMLRADLADAEALLARWPKCPAGCNCRIGIADDADANECGCDGPCNGGEQPAPGLADQRPATMLQPVSYNDEPDREQPAPGPADAIAQVGITRAAAANTIRGLRELVTELLAELARYGEGCLEDDEVAQWRKRAGLEGK